MLNTWDAVSTLGHLFDDVMGVHARYGEEYPHVQAITMSSLSATFRDMPGSCGSAHGVS
jgi:hypothetical protein